MRFNQITVRGIDMIQELLSAAHSVNSLLSLLKAANGLANYNEIVAAVSEVNTKLMQANAVALAAQEKQSALSAKIQELEQECARLKDWSAEKEKYERRQIAPGVFAQIDRSYLGDMQSAHKLCCNCFDKAIPSTLQQNHFTDPKAGYMVSLVCSNRCPTIVFQDYL